MGSQIFPVECYFFFSAEKILEIAFFSVRPLFSSPDFKFSIYEKMLQRKQRHRIYIYSLFFHSFFVYYCEVFLTCCTLLYTIYLKIILNGELVSIMGPK